MQYRKRKKRYIYLVLLIVVVIAAGFAYRALSSKNPSLPKLFGQTGNTDKTTNVSALPKWVADGTIITAADTEITRTNLKDKKDDQYDLGAKSLSPSSASDGSIIYLTQDNKLKLLSAGNKSTTIVDDNQFNPLPVISPDGKQILVVAFSNAERDFGYKVQLWSINNEYDRDITTSANKITSLCWLNDNTIVFNRSDGKSNEVVSVKIDGKGEQSLYKTGDLNINRVVGKNNVILFSAGGNASDQTSLELYKIDSGKAAKLSDQKDAYKEIQIAPSGKSIAYINKNNHVVILDVESRNSIGLDFTVGHLLGWYQ